MRAVYDGDYDAAAARRRALFALHCVCVRAVAACVDV